MHPKRLVLWILWFAITTGLCLIYVFLGGEMARSHGGMNEGLRFIPMVPLALSVVVRIFLLPKFTSLTKVTPVYVIGLALAEGSGILAIFLLSHGDAVNYFTTAVIVLLMYVPLFASKLEEN